MKTAVKERYQFSELSEKAKAKAIDDNRYYYVEGLDWWDHVYNDAKNIGLIITGFELDRSREITGVFNEHAQDTLKAILVEHGPGCDTYKTAARFSPQFDIAVTRMRLRGYSEDDIPYNFGEEFEDLVEDFKTALLRDYWDMLQNELDFLTKDETVAEALADYHFDEDGNIV